MYAAGSEGFVGKDDKFVRLEGEGGIELVSDHLNSLILGAPASAVRTHSFRSLLHSESPQLSDLTSSSTKMLFRY